MRTFRVYQVDAFTRRRFCGNPAGVIPNADGLTEEEMQQIARELNNSETAFIFASRSPDHDVQVRYFTPTTEVPVCGHATIAAHYVLASESGRAGRVRQLCGAGILPVDVVGSKGGYQIWMTQGKIEIQPPLDASTVNEIIRRCGMSSDDLDPRCPVQIVSTGHSKVLIGLKDRARMDSAEPDFDALASISKAIGCNGYFLFTLENGNESVSTHGRMFAPAIGIREDPVTGNANGPLGAYLVQHQLVVNAGTCLRFEGKQGDRLGRPGVVQVEVTIEAGVPTRVRIGGEAVIAFSGVLELE